MYPEELLNCIYDRIEANAIDKWLVLSDGRLTCKAILWRNEAFLKPVVSLDENQLRFGIHKRKDRKHITSKLYAYYHVEFIRMLLMHFDSKFESVSATAVKEMPDDY